MNREEKSPGRLIFLGRVVGAHGLRGQIRVGSSRRAAEVEPDTFTAVEEILLGGEPFRVRRAVRGRGHVLLKLAGVERREQAEALVGREVQAEAARFPELPAGEYYWFQLLGLPVINVQDGRELGRLEEIWPTAAHDVYVVRQGDQEILLPAVEEVIEAVDLEAGCIKVRPPAGLLEIYAD